MILKNKSQGDDDWYPMDQGQVDIHTHTHTHTHTHNTHTLMRLNGSSVMTDRLEYKKSL